MFCWDVGCGWESRHTTREIAKFGDKKRLQALAVQQANPALTVTTSSEHVGRQTTVNPSDEKESQPASADGQLVTRPESIVLTIHEATLCPARANEQGTCDPGIEILGNAPHVSHAEPSPASLDTFGSEDFKAENMDTARRKRPRTLVGSCRELVDWLRVTFPATMAVLSHLPLALIPFAFAMFVLVQALVSKHWVATFAYGWKHWVDKTGVVGGIGGMGFLSVVLCNVSFSRRERLVSIRIGAVSRSDMCVLVSLPAPTLALRFSCRASSRHGRRYIASAARRSTAAPFGPRCTAWPLASTMVPLAQRSAHRWPGCCGATFSRGRILRSPTSTLRGSICRSSACP